MARLSFIIISDFILKTFTDNFWLSNTEFIMDISNPNLSWFLRTKPSKLRPKERPSYNINEFRVEDHTTEPTSVARAYGAENMYRDVTEVDCMKFENLKWIIETPVEDIMKEYQNAIMVRVVSGRPAALICPYQGSIHIAELEGLLT
ncbi:hypothetical protein BG015_009739 [Linnemannia schmuckeri]|uniref:Uncharacterized protein n=1 Tax=Linnemannia schmuckeri TaxID=64567 RepID=A0A9P5RX64_9FUNG|nr:hypothetical protein BG015_009739 [Linnemannia schmuckeri]